jgi:DNA helicase HerA-like ATPase
MSDDPAHEFGRILVGKSDIHQYLTLALGNRHGLVAGATGTGKTVTLQVLAEGFSRAGTAVFAADIKGEIALRSAVQSAARTAVTKIGQAILRGILGGNSKK